MSSLRRNVGWAFVGNLVFVVCQWLILVSITKFASVRAAGDWILALAVTAPIFVFAQFRLRQVQSTDARGDFRWGDYAGLRLFSMLAAFVVSVALAAVVYPSVLLLIVIVALSKAFEAGSDLFYGEEQRRELLSSISKSMIVRGVAAAACAAMILWQTGSVMWAATLITLTYLVGMIVDARRVANRLDHPGWPALDSSRLGSLLRMVFPVGVQSAIGSLQTNIPRYFLEGETSRTELGIWSTMAALLVFGNTAITAIASSASARLARLAADAEWRAFKHLLGKMVVVAAALGAVAVIGSITIGESVLRLVYNEDVAAHADVLPWLAAASGILWAYVFFGTALDAMRRFRFRPWIHVAGSLSLIGTCVIFIPTHGMHGAAWATLVGYSVEFVLYSVAMAMALRARQRD